MANRKAKWTIRAVDVHLMYQQVKAEERAKREHSNAIRARAWYVYGDNPHRPYTWKWWRLGFQTRFARLIARGGDYTQIPGYDTLAQEVACEFPEFEGVDGTVALWDLLLSPYDPLPSRDRMLAEAEERVRKVRRRGRGKVAVGFEFGANTQAVEVF